MNHTGRTVAIFAVAALALPRAVFAAAGSSNLAGSPLSMERQHEVAVAEDYSFLKTPAEVREYAKEGQLVSVTESADLELAGVSFPYARPDVRLFLGKIAAEYHAFTGEKLVVTSLTRPTSLQPSNAHELSVHPAGMAVDFRVPARAKARQWLEQTLLDLERAQVLDVTREHTPSHYHVAVYTAAYHAYVNGGETTAAAPATPAVVPSVTPVARPTAASVKTASVKAASVNAPLEGVSLRGSVMGLLLATLTGAASCIGFGRRAHSRI